MATSESAAAIDFSIRAQFDEICQRLQTANLGERREKPIGYWALAADRRLPYALLDCKVSDIIGTPYRELARTPAIGKKKMVTLVKLLERVISEPRPETPATPTIVPMSHDNDRFSAETVSESHWEAWRETVRARGLSNELLGRLTPTLRSLPSVIWDTPLSSYLDKPLAQLRRMKTHGDKRVRGVLEVFYFVHRVLSNAVSPRHLVPQLRPAFTIPIEQWIMDVLVREELPSQQEIRQNLILPILNQIEIDGDETIGRLLAGRLGVESVPESVIEQADRLGVTRARVYQLIELSAHMMAVRYPEGRWQLAALSEHLSSLPADDDRRELLRTLRSLLYPDKFKPETSRPGLEAAHA